MDSEGYLLNGDGKYLVGEDGSDSNSCTNAQSMTIGSRWYSNLC